ncbi:MAG TPA: PaaI family thioesterase [Tepidisphaeraceae bacterium]|nr:PaaI family thioesterase [Tepidisphaeraceae bacterium]
MMSLLPLPRTEDCLVCGRSNPIGHRLRLSVDPGTGSIHVPWTPTPGHAGFERITHGGATATVLDEAMAWCAIWALKRMSVCAELTTRFALPLVPGTPTTVIARVESARARLVLVTGEVVGEDGRVYATASGKYLPAPPAEHATLLSKLLVEPESAETYRILTHAGAREP